MTKQERQLLLRSLVEISRIRKTLQLELGGGAVKAIAHLTPYRAAIPGTVVDSALDGLRVVLAHSDELLRDLALLRRNLRLLANLTKDKD